jgi:Ala-tRNA(Pro) deacylase
MCVLPACCKIDLNVLQKHLGVDLVELATESEMAELFPDCPIGAEPPFGNLYGLLTFMDTMLADDEYIFFQSGTHEDAVQMDTREFIKLAQPRILSFSYHTM